MKQLKITSFFLGALLVLAIGATVYWFNQEDSKLVAPDEKETKIYVNEEYGFQFEYPDTHEIQTLSSHGQSLGIRVNRIDRSTSQELLDNLLITLPPEEGGGYNPLATSLLDYESSYRTRHFTCPGPMCDDSEKIYYEARIHDTQRLVINGVIALRQVYSTGITLQNNESGEQEFDTSNVYGEGADHAIRFVFMNPVDQTVIILGPWLPEIHDTEFAEQIARSFKFNK